MNWLEWNDEVNWVCHSLLSKMSRITIFLVNTFVTDETGTATRKELLRIHAEKQEASNADIFHPPFLLVNALLSNFWPESNPAGNGTGKEMAQVL